MVALIRLATLTAVRATDPTAIRAIGKAGADSLSSSMKSVGCIGIENIAGRRDFYPKRLYRA